MSMTNSATGGAFATFMPPELTATFIDEELRVLGADAATRRDQFIKDIEEFRAKGVARVVDSQMTAKVHGVSVNAFSAPIFGSDGAMLMALTVIDRSSRLDASWDGEVPQILVEAANRISGMIQVK
jgi:DNA-binding IclR family transcriptional regulator